MKRFLLLTMTFLLLIGTIGCSAAKKHHGTDMPDPGTYNAHFGDMDADGDGQVHWEEFSAHFKDAEKKVFSAVDLNGDGSIDHDEWHQFKEAHGLSHHQ